MVFFNQKYNHHYDFGCVRNKAYIALVDEYHIEKDGVFYKNGGLVSSPWGTNQVILSGLDYCIKALSVNPGHMLSLQRHRARTEDWTVMKGDLTVILDGVLRIVRKGESLHIPKGAPHCVANTGGEHVFVREVQKGICREGDNIRLMDMNGRPTYPCGSEAEYRAACLYAELQDRLRTTTGALSSRGPFQAAGRSHRS
ncbi:MAG: hypothetical protein DI626_06030 [Micavibrio aeruginosavorus]|uniref:Mannose-6-phosphate isomerase type II C-terminal domain-containing protein n=1 Tax=Micavibrio aeruginosavorus TaxID=349221 RepID=A0A2W4ZWF6_9BACT|nr:MAG: hypothetical protein DI626_06030 [Micavibrio aeruginosavorus]